MRLRIPNPVSPEALRALVRHELRLLRQNRVAAMVLVITLLAAFSMRWRREKAAETAGPACYIVYWQEDDWVRHLRAAIDSLDEQFQPPIRLVAAEQLTDDDGVIRYPRGSHSIQLRPQPTEPGQPQRYLVWYWYDGADPAALWPYDHWFWRATHEHFAGERAWDERVSALRPELNVPGVQQSRLSLDALLDPQRADLAIVWVLLFFAACHLPALSLVESRVSGTLDSLVLTPGGWHGVLRAKYQFYLPLTVMFATLATFILRPQALLAPDYWLVVFAAAMAYLGVAMVIGTWCRSVASASGAAVVYLFFSSMLWAATFALPEPYAGWLAPWTFAEGAILTSLRAVWFPEHPSPMPWALLAVFVWAALWQVAAALSLWRLRQQ